MFLFPSFGIRLRLYGLAYWFLHDYKASRLFSPLFGFLGVVCVSVLALFPRFISFYTTGLGTTATICRSVLLRLPPCWLQQALLPRAMQGRRVLPSLFGNWDGRRLILAMPHPGTLMGLNETERMMKVEAGSGAQ